MSLALCSFADVGVLLLRNMEPSYGVVPSTGWCWSFGVLLLGLCRMDGVCKF